MSGAAVESAAHIKVPGRSRRVAQYPGSTRMAWWTIKSSLLAPIYLPGLCVTGALVYLVTAQIERSIAPGVDRTEDPVLLWWALLLAGCSILYTRGVLLGLLHAALHVVAAVMSLEAAEELAAGREHSTYLTALSLAVVSYLASGLVSGIFFGLASGVAGRHGHEALAALAPERLGTFVRLVVNKSSGRLRVHPIALKSVPRKWAMSGKTFVPRRASAFACEYGEGVFEVT